MNRLTRRTKDGGIDLLPESRESVIEKITQAIKRLAEYEDTGLMPDRAAELAQAEEHDQLVISPVPVGNNKLAFGISDDPDDSDAPPRIVTIECDRLDSLEIWGKCPRHEVVVEVDGWEIGNSDIGKTVFLTFEEAAAAMSARHWTDEELEKLWEELGDVPMDPETECLEEAFFIWEKGTDREDIWHWFDERHSKGVAYLLYRVEPED